MDVLVVRTSTQKFVGADNWALTTEQWRWLWGRVGGEHVRGTLVAAKAEGTRS